MSPEIFSYICFVCRKWPIYSVLVWSLCLLAMPVCAQEAAPDLDEKQEKLWQEAITTLNKGEESEARTLFFHYFRKYRDFEKAEEALWRSVNLRKSLALEDENPDWLSLKERYRRFIVEFPESTHIPQAYFEVGMAFFRNHYFREALTYFRLYVKQFPEAPGFDQSLFMQAQCLMNTRKFADAGKVYQQLAESSKKTYRLRGQAGEAHIHFAEKEYHAALGIYLRILRLNPYFYVADPEMMRRKGIANLQVGNEEEGRRDLFVYLNLVEHSSFEPEVLFDIGESYLREQDEQTARKIYAKIIEISDPGRREAIMSRFRQAQLRSAKEQLPAKGDDRPFQSVLDQYYSDEIAQDARYALIFRHWARKEYDQAYDLGKPFLRYDHAVDRGREVEEIMGRILELRVEKLLQEKEYKKIYQLYQNEYFYLKKYGRGRLLFLVGRAFEELTLYDKAAVVYYRALALELTEPEKIDLYLRRAEVYLAINDLKAAQRLLKYLRQIYGKDKAIGEIYFLSGRLREAQDRPPDAFEFYIMAAAEPTFPDRAAAYCDSSLRLLLELKRFEEAEARLLWYQQKKYLVGTKLQYWLGRLGDELRETGDAQGAARVYKAAVTENMDLIGEQAQKIYLHYGDVLFALGEKEESLASFKKAAAGKNQRFVKLAQARLDERDIVQGISEVKAALNR